MKMGEIERGVRLRAKRSSAFRRQNKIDLEITRIKEL